MGKQEMKYPNRLASLRADAHISQRKLARAIQIGESTIQYYEHGERDIPGDVVIKLARFFGCTANYLLCADDVEPAKADSGFVDVPLYGSIAAGKPIEMLPIDEMHPVPAQVRAKYPDSFLLAVKGTSMNRILPDGCFALINPCVDAEFDGKPYAVCVNGFDATIKRVRKLANGFILVPDSTDPTYTETVYNYNEPGTETITIIGEVVYYVLPFDWGF